MNYMNFIHKYNEWIELCMQMCYDMNAEGRKECFSAESTVVSAVPFIYPGQCQIIKRKKRSERQDYGKRRDRF